MIWSIAAMLLILVVAGAVVLYVAYPYRDERVPGAPWVGDALKKGIEALPTAPTALLAPASRDGEAADRAETQDSADAPSAGSSTSAKPV